jgi:GMP synthase (glutamine-hydrolysing)
LFDLTSDANVLPFPGRRMAAASLCRDSLAPVLIVLHQEKSTPGRVGNVLRALGYRLDIRRPRFGDPLPETLDAHAGAIIFGGPMSANDPDDYVRQEIAGSRFRCASSGRFWASAWAHKCSRCSSAPASRRIRKA